MSSTITVETTDHIATVILTRPTMPPDFFTECEEVFRRLSQDNHVRVVVVRSSAKVFSYGLDLPAAFQNFGHQFTGGSAVVRRELLLSIRRLQGAFQAIADCPVPVIAAIHGYCIGGGLDLISACDIRIASKDAKFSLRETKIAIVADLGSLQRLPAIIGQGHTRELAFTGKDIDADRARQIGLVNDVVASAEEAAEAARRVAEQIAHNPPLTVRGVKDVLNFGEGKTVADGLAYVAAHNAAFLATEDLGEAVAAFLEKRAPRYQGR